MPRPSRLFLLFLLAVVSYPIHAEIRGVVTTIAGWPTVSGNVDGSIDVALFNRPTWIDVVRDGVGAGHIYVTDRLNNALRRIAADRVSTVPGKGFEWDPSRPYRIDFGGPYGGGIAVEPEDGGCGGGVYDRGIWMTNTGSHQVVLLSPTGTFAARDDVFPWIGGEGEWGTRDGLNTEARLQSPTGVDISWNYPRFNGVGLRSLYIADSGNHTIRRVSFVLSFEACPQHKFVETLAGSAEEPGFRDGQRGAAQFNSPRGVAAGPDGNVYVADSGNHVIRKITPDARVTTIAGVPGTIGTADGPALTARMNTPSGIDINENGEIFFTDTQNHTVRMITSEGTVITIAGNPSAGGFADGEGSNARFAGPVGLRIAPDGSLLVADTSNHVIRRITLVRD